MEKMPGEEECGVAGRGSLNRTIRVGLTEKVAFDPRNEEGEETSHGDI